MKYIYHRKEQETEKQIVKVLQSEWRKKERNLKDENEQARLFNTVFERYVNEAKMEYPEVDVERGIEKIYMEELADLPDEVVREQATKRWPFQWPLDYLSRLAHRNSVALSQEPMRDVANILENEVMQRLSKIQLFDADFIISCIQMTKKVLEEKGIDKKSKRKHLHDSVKSIILVKLKEIQKKWNEDHNVAYKLEMSKERLWLKFKNTCTKRIGEEIITDEITSALKAATKQGYKDFLAAETFKELQEQPWVSSYKAMKAHIELDLIKNIEDKDRPEIVIFSILDAKGHYKEVLAKLIAKYRKPVWDNLKTAIASALKETVDSLKQCKGGFQKEFRRRFSNALLLSVRSKLNDQIWNNIEEDGDSERKDWIRIAEGIKSSVIERKHAVVQEISDEELRDLVTKVIEDKKGIDSASGLRCTAACPRCKMLCIKRDKHEQTESGDGKLHDTFHQPTGNSGGIWWKTNELVAKSCLQCFEDNDRFLIGEDGNNEDHWLPYTKFHEYYPSWARPHSDMEQKVREYIFANFQEELVR